MSLSLAHIELYLHSSALDTTLFAVSSFSWVQEISSPTIMVCISHESGDRLEVCLTETIGFASFLPLDMLSQLVNVNSTGKGLRSTLLHD